MHPGGLTSDRGQLPGVPDGFGPGAHIAQTARSELQSGLLPSLKPPHGSQPEDGEHRESPGACRPYDHESGDEGRTGGERRDAQAPPRPHASWADVGNAHHRKRSGGGPKDHPHYVGA